MSASDQPDDLAGEQPVSDISQVGDSRSETLRDNGYSTVQDVRRADVSDLEALFPLRIARKIKENAGDVPRNPPSIAEAKQRAQQRPGAKAKTVRVDGRQETRVLDKVHEESVGGAHMEIHKG